MIACMVAYAMHPTVLHEDSTLISGDFPHFTRAFLQGGVLPAGCPMLFHSGASGNQSPRHVARDAHVAPVATQHAKRRSAPENPAWLGNPTSVCNGCSDQPGSGPRVSRVNGSSRQGSLPCDMLASSLPA